MWQARRPGGSFFHCLVVVVLRALGSAALMLPEIDDLAPRTLVVIDHHHYRALGSCATQTTSVCKPYESWMVTIVDLNAGQVLGIVDGLRQ